MLEAQVAIDSETLKGDILVAALPGHPWGRLDKVHLLVIQWQDDALELQLLQRHKLGEAWPVESYPYIATSAGKVAADGAVITTRIDLLSTKRINLDPRHADKTVEKPILTPLQYSLVVDGGVKPSGVIASVVNAVKFVWNYLVS